MQKCTITFIPFLIKRRSYYRSSYTKRLCSVIYNHELEKTKFEYFLNDIQNCQANCLHVPAQKDELENTKMYSSELNIIQEEEEEEQQNMTGELTGDTLTQFL